MHKIMIVDDDRIIRKGLIQTIPWAENNFELVGEAGDGEQALELIRQQKPQIVVSDIKMPFMDGLTLARQTRELYPEIKFIFLTGYEDFSYAKQAIDLQAVDYLLKPVDRKVLLEKVQKAAAAWDKEQGSAMKLKVAEPYLKSMLFAQIVSAQESENVLQEKMAAHGLSLQHRCFLAMQLRIDDYRKEEIHPKREHKQLKEQIAKGAEHILQRKGDGNVFVLEQNAIVVIYAGDDAEEMEEKAVEIAQAICEWTRTDLKTTLTVGLGGVHEGLKNFADSFDEAHAVMAFRHVIGRDKVITMADLDHLVSEVGDSPDQTEHSLLEKVRLGLADDAQQVLSEMEDDLRSSRLSLGEVRLRAVDMFLALFKGAEDWAADWSQQHEQEKADYYAKISQATTVTEMVGLLRDVVRSLAQFMTDENSRERTDVIDDVTDYIEQHYAEHGLSLQDIGRYVHMNPIYLSVLFKKKKKITFTGFLLQIRMTHAMEMLRATDLKTYEVAERTGYSSPEYFGACFKKYTGCSPLEFRNRS
ncbi:MAG: response regulator [Selenomonas sp.]|jgi:two-component system response regulator YesN|nr:response regulator [Selenomonas sp.]MCI7330107.1 response regulator [Selenomonadaceae bacterium]MDD6119182.1 response regulator [Selenomonadaceae bacterium]MDY3916074.1 response regulator [Selenomonadaceae bacterium]HBT79079.1 DNA-binding response regulator [Selenomonas sp.]